MKITTLEDLLVDELKDIYSAENQLIKALPKMAKAAQAEDLRNAFEHHLEQTRTHAKRIEQLCAELNIKPGGKKCMGMEGLIEEGHEIMADAKNEPLEAGLIGAAQRVEHYEIAAYGTARAHARQLGYMKAAEILGETLEEEKEANRLLTELAENEINVQAAMASSD
jgi:ferritin-like metal-binding protein YciE